MALGELSLAVGVLTPLVVVSGIISGSETAIFGMTHPGRAKLSRESPSAARALAELLARPRPLLTALLACNIVVNVSYFSISSIIAVGLERDGHPYAAALVATGSLVAIILLGEIGAKLLASAQRVPFCRAVAGPWLLIIRLGWPLWSRIDRFVLVPLVRVTSTPGEEKGHKPSTETIAQVLSLPPAEGDGGDAAGDQRLLLQILRLGEIRAREAMQPRVEVVTRTLADSAASLRVAMDEADRVLVLDSHQHAPLGWLDPHTFLGAGSPVLPRERRRLIEDCIYVPEQATLDTVLDQLRRHGRDRAVVVDELGDFVGVVRIEDVVSQLLEEAGETRDASGDEPRLVALGRFAVPGRWPARGLLADLDIPHAEADRLLARVSTVGGLMLALLGKLPEAGDSVALHGAVFRVVEVKGRTIAWVEIDFHMQQGFDEPGSGTA